MNRSVFLNLSCPGKQQGFSGEYTITTYEKHRECWILEDQNRYARLRFYLVFLPQNRKANLGRWPGDWRRALSSWYVANIVKFSAKRPVYRAQFSFRMPLKRTGSGKADLLITKIPRKYMVAANHAISGLKLKIG